MKIAFGEIGRAKTHKTVADQEWIIPEGTRVVEALTAEITLQLTDAETITLAGCFRGAMESACARCGDNVVFPLNEDFVYLVTTREEELTELAEKECSDEECNTVFLHEPVIDIAELLQEQLYLAIPGKVVCSDDCRGLCQQCGGSQNRNECSCGGPEPDSPFAVLKKLRKE